MKYSVIVLILLHKVLHISCINFQTINSEVNNVVKSTYSSRDNEIIHNKTIDDEIIVNEEENKTKHYNNTNNNEAYIRTEIKNPRSNLYEVFEDLSEDIVETYNIYRKLKIEGLIFETAESRYPRRSIFPKWKSYQVTETSDDAEFQNIHGLNVHSYKVSEDIDEEQDKLHIKKKNEIEAYLNKYQPLADDVKSSLYTKAIFKSNPSSLQRPIQILAIRAQYKRI